MSEPYVHKLKRPVTAHGEQVSELQLEEPTTKLVMELGYPYLVVDGGVQLQPKVAARYISRLAKVPMSTVEALPIPDLQFLQAWIMGFFGDGAED
jgi:hypothetical protein